MVESFKGFFKDLCEYYNPKKTMSAMVIDAYKSICEDVSPEDTQALFMDVIRKYKYFPNVREFEDICEKYRVEKEMEPPTENKEACLYCRNSGLISYTVDLSSSVGYIDKRYACCPKCNLGKRFKNPYIKFYDEVFSGEELERLGASNRAGRRPAKESKSAFAYNSAKIGMAIPEEPRIDVNARRNQVLNNLERYGNAERSEFA